jgi:hypothetical protein
MTPTSIDHSSGFSLSTGHHGPVIAPIGCSWKPEQAGGALVWRWPDAAASIPFCRVGVVKRWWRRHRLDRYQLRPGFAAAERTEVAGQTCAVG